MTPFGITAAQVEETIDHPDSTHVVSNRCRPDIGVEIYVRRFVHSQLEFSLLVQVSNEEGPRMIREVIKLYPDLGPGMGDLPPVGVLRQFAQRFGLTISVGALRSQFVLAETISIADSGPNIFGFENPENHCAAGAFHAIAIHGPDPTPGTIGPIQALECMVCYVVDMDRYASWVNEHGTPARAGHARRW